MIMLVDALKILHQKTIHASNILLSQIVVFTLLCMKVKDNILMLYPSKQSGHDTLPILPNETRIFLSDTCNHQEKWSGPRIA